MGAPAPSASASSHPVADGPRTSELSPEVVRGLAGCWEVAKHRERWQLEAKGSRGLVVLREIEDESYADRARLPHDLSYQPSSDSFSFLAAGRNHGAMVSFKRNGAELEAWTYSSRAPHLPYVRTGNSFSVARCAP